MSKKGGWFQESQRHALAAKGVGTGRKRSPPRKPIYPNEMPIKEAQKIVNEHPLYISSWTTETGIRKYTLISQEQAVMSDSRDLNDVIGVLEIMTNFGRDEPVPLDYWDGDEGCFRPMPKPVVELRNELEKRDREKKATDKLGITG